MHILQTFQSGNKPGCTRVVQCSNNVSSTFSLLSTTLSVTCYKAVEKLSPVLQRCFKAHLLGYFILVSTTFVIKLLQAQREHILLTSANFVCIMHKV